MIAASAQPTRIVSVSVLGLEPSRRKHNRDVLELIAACIRRLSDRPEWAPYHAVLLPAGALRVARKPGWASLDVRWAQLRDRPPGRDLAALAERLGRKSPGCLLITGIDAADDPPWRGDMMMAAFNRAGPVGLARMVYPVKGHRTVVHLPDYDDAHRFVTLANGERAVLCVCYDAFALAELARDRAGWRGNVAYAFGPKGHRRSVDPDESAELLASFGCRLACEGPSLALVGIHRFERPGRDGLWQRHGLATASAALRGGLVVGASHFTEALPALPGQSPLAAFAVPRRHLDQGGYRPAREHLPLDGFEVALPWAPDRRALVRLYQTS